MFLSEGGKKQPYDAKLVVDYIRFHHKLCSKPSNLSQIDFSSFPWISDHHYVSLAHFVCSPGVKVTQ